MSQSELFSMVRSHAEKHCELLVVLLRIFANTMILMFALNVAGRYFGDTYFANVGVFMLLSAATELVMSCYNSCLTKIRYYAFLACIFGMLISGSVVLHGSCNAAKACNSPPSTVR